MQFNDYKPISTLLFIGKIIEDEIFKQLTSFLSLNSFFFWTTFSQDSSPTIAMRLLNNLHVNTDSGRTSVLLLLNLSATLDTTDHKIVSLNDYGPIDTLWTNWMCRNFFYSWIKIKQQLFYTGTKIRDLDLLRIVALKPSKSKEQVHNLVFQMDSVISVSSHDKAIIKSAFYHLKTYPGWEILCQSKALRNGSIFLFLVGLITVMVSGLDFKMRLPEFSQEPKEGNTSLRLLGPYTGS